MLGQGWRIESRTRGQTVLVRGSRPNHVLHVLLSVFTLGLWVPVWILVCIFGGEEHHTLSRSDW